MNLTYAWKFKVATKNRKESKVSSDKQWTEHINTSIHVEELWHSVHRNTCPCLRPEAATGSPTSVHENRVVRRSRPSSSSSASTWSAWLLLQKQTKGFEKKNKNKKKKSGKKTQNLLSCWSLKILLEESLKVKQETK